jgi:hypothetical protein
VTTRACCRASTASSRTGSRRATRTGVRKLDELLSRDLLFQRADKSVIGKKEFMEGLSGPSPFLKRASRNVKVVLRNERALATLIGTTTKVDGSVNRYRNIRWFARDGGRWRLECWFNDDIAALAALADV